MLYLYLALAALGYATRPAEFTGGRLGATGTVVSLTRRAVTIRDVGTGHNRRFPVCQDIRDGGCGPDGPSMFCDYKLSDLKVGDQIRLDYRRGGNVYECTALCILRRPGGRVPLAWGKDEYWEVRMNAEQDAEAAGLPLPASRYDVVPFGTPPRWEYRQP